MCTASAGKRPCSVIAAAMVTPRLTDSATRSTQRATIWFDIMSPTTAMAPSTGTPLRSIVPSVRVIRAVSTLVVTLPMSGSCNSV